MGEQERKRLELEIAGYKTEATKQRKLIAQLERARETLGLEASEGAAKFAAAVEEIKLRV